jgi:hypothetical protein
MMVVVCFGYGQVREVAAENNEAIRQQEGMDKVYQVITLYTLYDEYEKEISIFLLTRYVK